MTTIRRATRFTRAVPAQARHPDPAHLADEVADVAAEAVSKRWNLKELRRLVQAAPDQFIEQVLAKLQARLGVAPEEGQRKARPGSEEAAVDKEMAQYEADELESLKELEREGQLITVKALSERMDMSPQALNKAIANQRLFRIKVGSQWLVPAFYADRSIDTKALEEACKALGGLSGTSKWQFFTNRRVSLGGATPLELLRRGEAQRVVDSARGFFER